MRIFFLLCCTSKRKSVCFEGILEGLIDTFICSVPLSVPLFSDAKNSIFFRLGRVSKKALEGIKMEFNFPKSVNKSVNKKIKPALSERVFVVLGRLLIRYKFCKEAFNRGTKRFREENSVIKNVFKMKANIQILTLCVVPLFFFLALMK